MKIPKTEHFRYKKLSGSNYLIAGGAAAQIWFPTGSNISLSLISAKLAPMVLNSNPKEWLKVYEDVVVNLSSVHKNYDLWIRGKYNRLGEVGNFAKAIFSSGNKRMALYAVVRNDKKYRKRAQELSKANIPDHALLRTEARVKKESNLSRQIEVVNESRDKMKELVKKV